MKTAKEIDSVRCLEVCQKKLECGHACQLPCHPFSRGHRDCLCQELCERVKPDCGHRCTKMCREECGPCRVRVERRKPCFHTVEFVCSQPDSPDCSVPCTTILDCGHPCAGNCNDCAGLRLHVPCNICPRKCPQQPCPLHCHPWEVKLCTEQCPLQLECGHLCSGVLGEHCPDLCFTCEPTSPHQPGEK